MNLTINVYVTVRIVLVAVIIAGVSTIWCSSSKPQELIPDVKIEMRDFNQDQERIHERTFLFELKKSAQPSSSASPDEIQKPSDL